MVILAVDPGLSTCGWAVVRPVTGAIVELGFIGSEREAAYDVSTDRIQRLAVQATTLAAVAGRHEVTRIIGEAVTLGGPVHVKLAMSVGLHLSWGVLTELARARGARLYEVRPQVWQDAIQPVRKGKKIDYPRLERAMAEHVGPQVGAQLACIGKADRNHALDACGIGMLLALRPQLATRIVMPAKPRVVMSETVITWFPEERKDVTR
jgi:hypothetical protein